jgi:hypothetical protein
MAASELPTDLVRAQGRFEAWRKLRKKGNRIPQSLWRLAVRLASSYSIHRTATALKLDYYSLKQQVEAAADTPESNSPRFVELPPPPVTVSKQGLFELSNGAGETMRVQLVGYEVAEIEVLARGFWKAE